MHHGWHNAGIGICSAVRNYGSGVGVMINAKIILASAALFAAPASAQSLEPADAMMNLIKMETANQYCGLTPPRSAVERYVKIVMPLMKVDANTFVQSVRSAAGELGANYERNGSLPGFCANVGAIYGRYGK